MWLDIIILIVGLALIYYGGELFVNASVALAEILGWSKLIIGVIILGFGTSAPEIAISIASNFKGHGDIIVGNIVGSNIANVLLILGLSLLIKPLKKAFHVSYIYTVLLVLSTALLIFGIYFQYFSRWLGISMLLITIAATWFLIALERSKVIKDTISHKHNIFKTIGALILGLLLLVLSAHIIIRSVVNLSEAMGIAKAVIATSVVALGTSLPELVLSVIAARKNHFDLVLGNIIGSNVSNVLLGIGISAGIIPFSISNAVSQLTLIMLLVSTVILLLLIYQRFLRSRLVGFISLAIYVGFIILLYT